MKIYPLIIGKRIFLFHEWQWMGWRHWLVGIDLSYEPTLCFGPIMLVVYED